ncbi:GDSL-type esterase/lipase family protein [Ktedonosporobacter rubrisoli]|nr:GDSL-type esterase/lipase family protein [Ktedonosporobacter rubrisoli]
MSSDAGKQAEHTSIRAIEKQAYTHWVGAWYAAPTQMPIAHLSGRTLRQIVHMHVGGELIRLRLSNRYGDAAITISAAFAGKVLEGPELGPGERAVLFEGRETVTLEAGQEVISDPVALRVEAASDLAITFFLARGEILSGHLSAQQTSYISGLGNVTATSAETAFFAYPLLTTSWWLISGVDVLPARPLNAVVAIGSSVTDGVGSTLNANRRWPDYLAHRLREAGGTRFMSVLNAGISGNQLLSSATPQLEETGIPAFLAGEAGMQRMAWDVMTQPGATDLIVHIASNDLRADVAGPILIEAFQQLAMQARKTYRKVFGTTILPGGYSPAQIEQRRLVNRWMLEQGKQWFDAIFDFAAPLCSPEDEALLNQVYDSGDGVHPNDAGYRLMAEAVDINQLTGSLGVS